MLIVLPLLLVMLTRSSAIERWRWGVSESIKIDPKVQFVDDDQGKTPESIHTKTPVQRDDVPFHQPTDTIGFYNRPPGSGRYPMRSEHHNMHHKSAKLYKPASDGTLDSIQYCKCVTTPDCPLRADSENACGPNKYLCCYKNVASGSQNSGTSFSEYFNEVNDDRPILLPNQESMRGAFPPPPDSVFHSAFGPHHDSALIGNAEPSRSEFPQRKPLLIGPSGPTGIIGPNSQQALVGPGGPTGHIGPEKNVRQGEVQETSATASAQRGVLYGPGGPTGIIGPYGQRSVLVGPGGPSGIVGPRQTIFSRPRRPSLLVGPGGPTGIIGPGRQILVGPRGPTGIIGPNPFGK